jgi:hypothetical protein
LATFWGPFRAWRSLPTPLPFCSYAICASGRVCDPGGWHKVAHSPCSKMDASNGRARANITANSQSREAVSSRSATKRTIGPTKPFSWFGEDTWKRTGVLIAPS